MLQGSVHALVDRSPERLRKKNKQGKMALSEISAPCYFYKTELLWVWQDGYPYTEAFWKMEGTGELRKQEETANLRH